MQCFHLTNQNTHAILIKSKINQNQSIKSKTKLAVAWFSRAFPRLALVACFFFPSRPNWFITIFALTGLTYRTIQVTSLYTVHLCIGITTFYHFTEFSLFIFMPYNTFPLVRALFLSAHRWLHAPQFHQNWSEDCLAPQYILLACVWQERPGLSTWPLGDWGTKRETSTFNVDA